MVAGCQGATHCCNTCRRWGGSTSINLAGDYLWRSTAKVGADKFRPVRLQRQRTGSGVAEKCPLYLDPLVCYVLNTSVDFRDGPIHETHSIHNHITDFAVVRAGAAYNQLQPPPAKLRVNLVPENCICAGYRDRLAYGRRKRPANTRRRFQTTQELIHRLFDLPFPKRPPPGLYPKLFQVANL